MDMTQPTEAQVERLLVGTWKVLGTQRSASQWALLNGMLLIYIRALPLDSESRVALSQAQKRVRRNLIQVMAS